MPVSSRVEDLSVSDRPCGTRRCGLVLIDHTHEVMVGFKCVSFVKVTRTRKDDDARECFIVSGVGGAWPAIVWGAV